MFLEMSGTSINASGSIVLNMCSNFRKGSAEYFQQFLFFYVQMERGRASEINGGSAFRFLNHAY